MKLAKIFLGFLILLATLQTCFGQEKSGTVLIDESEFLGCEDFWQRLDSFFNQLSDDLQSKGYVVIYGKENELLKNLTYESWTNGIINFRGFDKNRIEVIRNTSNENPKFQFWKIPIGEKPNLTKADWSYKIPKSRKPFIFNAYTWADGLCPGTSYVKLYADLLKANEQARGHLVIRDKTDKRFRKTERKVLNELVNEYKIPRNRLKIFYVKDKEYPYDFTNVEFWFVP